MVEPARRRLALEVAGAPDPRDSHAAPVQTAALVALTLPMLVKVPLTMTRFPMTAMAATVAARGDVGAGRVAAAQRDAP